AFGPVYRLDARLRECDYGVLNGAPVGRVAAVRLQHIEEPFPGGESYRDVVARTASFLDDLRARHEGERVVLIAHSANRWAIEHLLFATPLADLLRPPFDWRPGWGYRLA